MSHTVKLQIIFFLYYFILLILITLPMTTASNERSFCILQLNYSRNTTGENRSNSLAVMNIYRD